MRKPEVRIWADESIRKLLKELGASLVSRLLSTARNGEIHVEKSTQNNVRSHACVVRLIASVCTVAATIACEALYFQFLNHRAIIQGKWKLVSAYDRPWELHRLDTDRTETIDLSSRYPDRVRGLEESWTKWWGPGPFNRNRSATEDEPVYIRMAR
jgi:hypothetical protein